MSFRFLLLSLFSVLSLVVGAPHARADFEVVDDHHVLDNLRTWIQQKPFNEAMACGSTAQFDSTDTNCQVRCTNQMCQSQCMGAHGTAARFSVTVGECSEGIANVFSDRGHTVQVTPADFTASSSTDLIPFLKQLSIFFQPEGTAHLTFAFPQTLQYIDNGQMRAINAVKVEVQMSFGTATQREEYDVWVTGDLDGARQILAIRVWDGHSTLMQLRGLIIENHP